MFAAKSTIGRLYRTLNILLIFTLLLPASGVQAQLPVIANTTGASYDWTATDQTEHARVLLPDNVIVSAYARDGSSGPIRGTVSVRKSGTDTWYNYVGWSGPSKTYTSFHPGPGDWDLRLASSGVLPYFVTPPKPNAVHCNEKNVCLGGASFEVYAKYGSISGHVIRLPEGIPAWGVYVWASTPGCYPDDSIASYYKPIDENGFYTFNRWPPPDNGSLRVFGDGSGPGVAHYVVSATGVRCEDAQATDISSNVMKTVDFTIKAPNMEDPTIRPCNSNPCDPGSPDGPPGGSQSTGNPISVVTGNMYLDQTDMIVPTPGMDLDFVRSYNSQLAYRSVGGGFGPGWTHPYEQNLSFPYTGIIMLRQGDGVPIYFQDMDANLTYEASVPFNQESRIKKRADGTYIRRLRKGGSETYDSAGRLTSLVDSFGNTTTLGRDGSHRLTSINGPGSRSLTLTYNASNRIETLSGPAGLIATYTYDASNRLQKVTYADGRGFMFVYDDHNQLLTVSDLSGKVLETHIYTGDKAITSEISEEREKYTLSYKPLQTTVTDALGNVTTYDWVNIWGMKYVTKITGPCASCGSGGNQTQQWTYDDKGRVLSYSDGNLNKTTYAYDAKGDLISETDPRHNLTAYTIYPDGRRKSMAVKSAVDPAQNKVTLYEYDRGAIKTQTERGLLGDGTQFSYTTSYSYDTNGNLTGIDGPRTDVGDITTFDYDIQTGDLISVSQPLAGTTSYSNFTPLGQPQAVTDPNGLVTTYDYDPQRRISAMVIGSDTTGYTYTPSGKLDTLTLPRGNASTYIYDPYDRLISIHNSLGNSINYSYDLMSRTTKEEITDADDIVQKWVSFEYDNLGRLERIVNPDGSDMEYSYDEAGNRTSMITPRGDTTIYRYNTLNLLRAAIQPGDIRTIYRYDTQGNLTSITDANQNVTTYFYDDLGRVYQEISPDTGTTTYTYDAAGNRISKTDDRGVTIRYRYDELNRLKKINFPSDPDIVYTYDTCQNGKGRLCQVEDQSGTTQYSYNQKGQLIQESKTITGVSGEFLTLYSYDPNGNLTSITYPSGRDVTYTYDLADRVTSVSTTPTGGTPQMLASNITYKPFGGVLSFDYGNGLTRTVTYDDEYRITAIQSGSVQDLTYLYDSNGNVKEINNLIDPAQNKAYDYDPLDRLEAASGPWGVLAWTYDGVGNRLTQTDNTGISTYTYQPGTNRLASVSGPSPITFGYNRIGSTNAENSRRYAYNQNGRLSQAKDGSTILGAYTYNANGQRVKKEAEGVTTIFHFDGQGQLIAETDADGSLVAEYIHLNGLPLATGVGSTLNYIHTDHLGTPVAMTDANGMKVWEIEARPFGDGATITGTAALNLRFPGQYFDQETGLHQNWFRDYAPISGRYLQSDPLGLITSNQTYGYSYAMNNPVRKIDLDGRSTMGVIWDWYKKGKEIVKECKKAIECYKVGKSCQADVRNRCYGEFGEPPSTGGFPGSGDPKWAAREYCLIKGYKCCTFKVLECRFGYDVAKQMLELAKKGDPDLNDCTLE